ncbi:MAG TPA: AAA family ATPase [Solirubrobacteraceae bacterium]
MRYTYFEFENFKGIRKARLDLAPSGSSARVYTLVGLNESGKTTVLEGTDYFQGAGEDEIRPKQLGDLKPLDHQSVIPMAERANFKGTITVRCGVELDDADVAAVQNHLAQVDGYRLKDLGRNLIIADHYHYKDSQHQAHGGTWTGIQGSGLLKSGRKERQLTDEKETARRKEILRFLKTRLPSIWYFPHFLFDFPDKIFIEPHDDETDSNRFYRALFQDLLDALEKELDIQKHIVERQRSEEASDKENLRQVILEASRHVTNTVVASWDKIFHDKPLAKKRVTIEIGQDEQPEAPGRIWVEFGIEDTDGFFAIADRSLGFRWFFVYLMLTTYRGQRKETDENMLYLFDEPASNLHPTAQRTLLASFVDLSKKAVIIYTTHSHYLIEPAWLGLTSIVANEGLGEQAVSTDFTAKRTDISVTSYHQFAAQHPNQSHYFQPILDVLDYAPSAIDPAPEAVMVEGKSDFYLLRYYEEVILGRSDSERLRWMPGGGAGTLDELIQLYIGWARPYVALLDSDKAGETQKDRYLEKFGLIVGPHLVLLAEASGSDVKGIESLLTDDDKLTFQRLIKPDATLVSKKTLARGVQEALVTKTTVELSDTAKAALDTTIAHLRRKLIDGSVPVCSAE